MLNSILFGGSSNPFGSRSGNIILSTGSRQSAGNSIQELLSSMGIFGGIGSSSLNSSDDGLEHILNYLLTNDPNKHGNPPASKQEVENLENIKISQGEIDELKKSNCIDCSVCKDEFELSQVLKKLPCSHLFHVDCLIPWLKQRNSCPTCRFELPTDDVDYEKRKKKMS